MGNVTHPDTEFEKRWGYCSPCKLLLLQYSTRNFLLLIASLFITNVFTVRVKNLTLNVEAKDSHFYIFDHFFDQIIRGIDHIVRGKDRKNVNFLSFFQSGNIVRLKKLNSDILR